MVECGVLTPKGLPPMPDLLSSYDPLLSDMRLHQIVLWICYLLKRDCRQSESSSYGSYYCPPTVLASLLAKASKHKVRRSYVEGLTQLLYKFRSLANIFLIKLLCLAHNSLGSFVAFDNCTRPGMHR